MDFRRTAAEMAQDTREKLVIDLRGDREYQMGTYPGSRHIYWEEFEEHMNELPKNMPIYLMCYTGETSDEYAKELQGKEYEAYSIREGYRGYLRWSFAKG